MILRNPIDAIFCFLWTRALYRVGREMPWRKIIAIHVYARRILPTPRPEKAAADLLDRCVELGAVFSKENYDELIVQVADILRPIER